MRIREGIELLRRVRWYLFLVAVAMFTISYHFVLGDIVREDSPGVLEVLVTIGLLSGGLYVFTHGVALSSWKEAKRLLIAGILFVVSVPFSQAALSHWVHPPAENQLVFQVLPGGSWIISFFVSVTALTIVFFGASLIRLIYIRVTGSDGLGGQRLTPEERVLSESELEEFDHPHKNLREFLVSTIIDWRV